MSPPIPPEIQEKIAIAQDPARPEAERKAAQRAANDWAAGQSAEQKVEEDRAREPLIAPSWWFAGAGFWALLLGASGAVVYGLYRVAKPVLKEVAPGVADAWLPGAGRGVARLLGATPTPAVQEALHEQPTRKVARLGAAEAPAYGATDEPVTVARPQTQRIEMWSRGRTTDGRDEIAGLVYGRPGTADGHPITIYPVTIISKGAPGSTAEGDVVRTLNSTYVLGRHLPIAADAEPPTVARKPWRIEQWHREPDLGGHDAIWGVIYDKPGHPDGERIVVYPISIAGNVVKTAQSTYVLGKPRTPGSFSEWLADARRIADENLWHTDLLDDDPGGYARRQYAAGRTPLDYAEANR